MPSEKSTVDQYRKMLVTHRRELEHRFHISSLGLFGSQLRGDQQEDSDLDILVTFSTTPSLLQFANLQYHLSDLLGVKVDLVMQDSLKPNIGKRILKEVVPV
jgi:uncharacterized protein